MELADMATLHASEDRLLGIGQAAARTGVSVRALRYYQELGLLSPSGCTPGGMRRYSEADLDRVARIRELQNLLGLNLDEIGEVLANDDAMASLRERYHDERTEPTERRRVLRQCLDLQQQLRSMVETKRAGLDAFLSDLDGRIARIKELLEEP